MKDSYSKQTLTEIEPPLAGRRDEGEDGGNVMKEEEIREEEKTQKEVTDKVFYSGSRKSHLF